MILVSSIYCIGSIFFMGACGMGAFPTSNMMRAGLSKRGDQETDPFLGRQKNWGCIGKDAHCE